VTFKLLLLNSDTTSGMGGFFLSSATNVFNFWIGTILQCTLGYCNVNTYEDEEVVFIGQRSGEPLQWRHISRNIDGRNI
jgi:hypothetical protein